MRTVAFSTCVAMAAAHGSVSQPHPCHRGEGGERGRGGVGRGDGPSTYEHMHSVQLEHADDRVLRVLRLWAQVVNPPPRNAVDKDLAPWNGPVPCHVQGKCPSVETQTGWCPVPDKDGKVSGQNGQSCCASTRW